MNIAERIDRWRHDAAILRRWGAKDMALVLESAAADLEEEMRRNASALLIGADGEELPELVELSAAVALSGYTRGHLRRMIVARTLTNYGTEARPLLRAAELPRKPGLPSRQQAREAQ